MHGGAGSLMHFLDYPSEPPRGSPWVVPTEGHFLGASLRSWSLAPRKCLIHSVTLTRAVCGALFRIQFLPKIE